MESKPLSQSMQLGAQSYTDVLNGVIGGAIKDFNKAIQDWLKTQFSENVTLLLCSHTYPNKTPKGKTITVGLTISNRAISNTRRDTNAALHGFQFPDVKNINMVIDGLDGGPFDVAYTVNSQGRFVKTLHQTPGNNLGVVHFEELRMVLSTLLSSPTTLTDATYFKLVDDGKDTPVITLNKTTL